MQKPLLQKFVTLSDKFYPGTDFEETDDDESMATTLKSVKEEEEKSTNEDSDDKDQIDTNTQDKKYNNPFKLNDDLID